MEWMAVTNVTSETTVENGSAELILLLDGLTSNLTLTDFGPSRNIIVGRAQWYESGRVLIPLYAVICMLAVVGNTLVILTLVQNQRMRTITNLFLLNLAVSDLLLGVFCIPFTLTGNLLRNFIFGKFMCKLIPFLQACAVSVGVWTLVVISIERYYAICHPLSSLRWQTISHAYKMIVAIWTGSLICMAPIAILSQLKPTNQGNHKCREDWPSLDYERAYNIFLDIVLLVVPLLALAVTYFLITRTLCRGMRTERALRDYNVNNGAMEVYINLQGLTTTSTPAPTPRRWSKSSSSCDVPGGRTATWRQMRQNWSQESTRNHSQKKQELLEKQYHHQQNSYLRRTNAERSLLNKKRVIKMLFAVVLEFFICWTPLYTINTIVLFNPSVVYNNLGYTTINFFQLLAYCSSCCNPITYCFMNCAFRKSFLNLFKCLKKMKDDTRKSFRMNGGNSSEMNNVDGSAAGMKWTSGTPNKCLGSTEFVK